MVLVFVYSRRDNAHKKIKEIFYAAIKARRESESQDDMLQTLIDTKYKWDRQFTCGILCAFIITCNHMAVFISAHISCPSVSLAAAVAVAGVVVVVIVVIISGSGKSTIWPSLAPAKYL